MTDLLTRWSAACLVAVCAIAAASDARAGLIPNWLTLPALVCALVMHAALGGLGEVTAAAAGALACALPPLLLFAMRAAGGGDVKLFAALGAIAGAHTGLELQFIGYALALAHALGALAWRGQLRATCARALALMLAPLARGRVQPPALAAMASVRLGVPVLAAALLLLARRVFEATP